MLEDDLNIEVNMDNQTENLDLLNIDFEVKQTPDHVGISSQTMASIQETHESPSQQKKALDELAADDLSKPISLKDQLVDSVVGNPKKQLNYALGIISTDYWSQYFSVTDIEIKDRLISSLNCLQPNFTVHLGEKIDLYGPFWICALLVFVCSVCGNLFKALSHMILDFWSDSQLAQEERYNFERIGSAIC